MQFVRTDFDDNGARERLIYHGPETLPRYVPEAMLIYLAVERAGWELVHMEPVPEGGKTAYVGFTYGGDVTQAAWSRTYVCVFKLRLPDEPEDA